MAVTMLAEGDVALVEEGFHFRKLGGLKSLPVIKRPGRAGRGRRHEHAARILPGVAWNGASGLIHITAAADEERTRRRQRDEFMAVHRHVIGRRSHRGE